MCNQSQASLVTVQLEIDYPNRVVIGLFEFSQTLKIGNVGINYSHIYLQFSSLFAPCKVSNDTSKVKLAILAFLYCREFVKNY